MRVRLQAFTNLTLSTRRELCAVMVFALVELQGTVVMNDGEPLDSWSVIINGEVEVRLPDGRTEQLSVGDRSIWCNGHFLYELLTLADVLVLCF